MKKVLLVVTVLMIAVMLTTMFVGCSAEDYKKQLEKKDYSVVVATNGDIAGKATMASALATLKLAGIEVKGDLEYIVFGTKSDSVVTIIKFEKSGDASALKKQVKSDAKDSDVKVSGTGKVVKLTISK